MATVTTLGPMPVGKSDVLHLSGYCVMQRNAV